MKKREAEFTTQFVKWYKYAMKGASGAFEMKITTGKSIAFNAVQPHQLNALTVASEGIFAWKIPDCGFQNPFDVIVLNQQPAYVVIHFVRPKNKEFFMIPVISWKNFQLTSLRKSITEKECREIGYPYTL